MYTGTHIRYAYWMLSWLWLMHWKFVCSIDIVRVAAKMFDWMTVWKYKASGILLFLASTEYKARVSYLMPPLMGYISAYTKVYLIHYIQKSNFRCVILIYIQKWYWWVTFQIFKSNIHGLCFPIFRRIMDMLSFPTLKSTIKGVYFLQWKV